MTQESPQSGMPDASDPVSAQADPANGRGKAVRSVDELSTLIGQSAHDLRSSLNAIQSWAYVLDRAFDATPAPAQRALDGIRAGMQQQLALIEEMEEAVQLLSDERAPRWQHLDLLALTAQAIAERRPAADARGVLLSPVTTGGAAGSPPAPESAGSPQSSASPDASARAWWIDGDAVRLPQLLRHLLVHCIWRAPAGGSVAVHLQREPDFVKLRITESPPVNRQRGASRLAALTDFFGRGRAPDVGAATARQSSALLLTRRMVELHGAVLSAESDTWESDTITVCIAIRFPRHMRA
jgi:signal transduction histidine kinase